MLLRRLSRYSIISGIIRTFFSNEVPRILRFYRGIDGYYSWRIKFIAYIYRVVISLGVCMFFIPLKYRAIFQAIKSLHLHDNFEKSLNWFRLSVSLNYSLLVDTVLLLARIEFLANTENSYTNSIKILEFVYALSESDEIMYQLALRYLAKGRVDEAGMLLLKLIRLNPKYAMPHQNLAAKCDHKEWSPEPLDLLGDIECYLYDAYNYWGQQLINLGEVTEALLMFGRSIELQNKLSLKYSIPQHLLDKLKILPNYDNSKANRIVPYEWVTQIGHMGMLDALIKMSRLGMRPDVNWILLAPIDKVANLAYLECWTKYFVIVSDKTLSRELFPYQRICGEQFNCYVDHNGVAVDWFDAAASAFREWDDRKLGPLVSIPTTIFEYGQNKLSTLGLPKDAWFVALHVRSSGFYNESFRFVQKHRNASLSSYIAAVKAITKQGGWVIRMGDSSMPKMPRMKNVIDVAHK